MKPRIIIIGQKVSPEKIKRAKELRRNMTPAEKILWEHIRAKSFNNLKLRRQQIIEGFIIDFYCHSLGLVIEIDGEIHNKQKKTIAIEIKYYLPKICIFYASLTNK